MAKYILAVVNYIPIIGHIKSFVHRFYGNKEAAARASLAATRTTAVLAAGTGGFLMGGPPAAAVCGTLAGFEWDLGAILPSSGKELKENPKVVDKPKSFKSWIDGAIAVATGGIVGVLGGKISEIAKASKTFFAVKSESKKSLMKESDLPQSGDIKRNDQQKSFA